MDDLHGSQHSILQQSQQFRGKVHTVLPWLNPWSLLEARALRLAFASQFASQGQSHHQQVRNSNSQQSLMQPTPIEAALVPADISRAENARGGCKELNNTSPWVNVHRHQAPDSAYGSELRVSGVNMSVFKRLNMW
ncbi:MAG: hypothetical protein HC767_06775 [Akkermansiaceae bacterium]|nr:hypothetical protein [Akkermansiaceae bacterium]